MAHSLAEAAAHFAEVGIEMTVLRREALEEGCEIIEKESKRVIGTYDYGWPPLAASTLARKSADTPLLETGEMRDSIEHVVIGDAGYVGSNNMKAVWQELGTSRGIPPRSFLAGAAQHKAHEIVGMVGRRFVAVVVGNSV